MKKEIPVRELPEEEMIENLEQEEQLEQGKINFAVEGIKESCQYAKEIIKENKVFLGFLLMGFIILVLGCTTLLYINKYNAVPKTAEDIRKYRNLRANNYLSGATKLEDSYKKGYEYWMQKRKDAEWCIEANSHTGITSDCFIFNNK